MKKKVKVHMLPTGDITGIVMHSTGLDKIVHTKESELNAVLNIGGTSQHLYFTSDEKIEEGDWALYLECGTNDEPLKDAYPYLVEFPDESHWNDRKIVATTDTSIKLKVYDYNRPQKYNPYKDIWTGKPKYKHIQLPQIPQSFIKQYVEAGGKIDEVEIEIELKSIPVNKEMPIVGYITYHDLKLDSNNCVIVHSIEEKLYTVEDIKNFGLWLGQIPKKQKFRTIDSLFNEWNN